MNGNIKIGLAAAGGLCVGTASTYIIVTKRLVKKYDAQIEKEIDDARAFFKNKYDKPEVQVPEDQEENLTPLEKKTLDAAMDKVLEREGYAAEDESEELRLEDPTEATIEEVTRPEDNPILKNVFSEAKKLRKPSTSDISNEELESRDSDTPYIISTDEFFDDSNHFDKVSVAFYEGDNTLCDEKEQFVPDVNGTVGAVNLNQFGKGSGDKNVLYVRNETLHIDYEVVRHEGSYTEIVLGMPEPEEAPVRRPRKKKEDD